MAELDPSDFELAAALRAYAEDAPTHIRPTAIARQFAEAYPHRRASIGHWSVRLTPAFAWTLLVAGLLSILIVGGLMIGMRRDTTEPPGIGLAWAQVTDPDLPTKSWAGEGDARLSGVIAGGPGAIAWGSGIWTTTDGIDWMRASVAAMPDADPMTEVSVSGVAAGGPGFVAVGSYHLVDSADFGSVAWTSIDGTRWDVVAMAPATDPFELDSVVSWRGELFVFGVVCGTAGCEPRVATSPDGSTWAVDPVSLPAGVAGLSEITASADRFWARALPLGWEAAPSLMLVTSADGRTWTLSKLRMIPDDAWSPASFHLLPDGMYALVPFAFAADARPLLAPGVYRSTDMETWKLRSVGLAAAGNDLIAIGDTLVMVGDEDTETCRSAGSMGCRAMAWRSLDGGVTWQAIPGSPAGQMDAVAALPDGTLVAVGSTEKLGGVHMFGNPTVWVSQPARR